MCTHCNEFKTKPELKMMASWTIDLLIKSATAQYVKGIIRCSMPADHAINLACSLSRVHKASMPSTAQPVQP